MQVSLHQLPSATQPCAEIDESADAVVMIAEMDPVEPGQVSEYPVLAERKGLNVLACHLAARDNGGKQVDRFPFSDPHQVVSGPASVPLRPVNGDHVTVVLQEL